MLFDDILPAKDCCVDLFAGSLTHSVPALAGLLLLILILNATTWVSAGAFQITLRSRLRNDLEQLRQVAHRV